MADSGLSGSRWNRVKKTDAPGAPIVTRLQARGVQQRIGLAAIGDLAGQQEAQRSAFAVGEGVELAVAAAPADPDRPDERPLFRRPPSGAPSCGVLSIRPSAGGPPTAASVTNGRAGLNLVCGWYQRIKYSKHPEIRRKFVGRHVSLAVA